MTGIFLLLSDLDCPPEDACSATHSAQFSGPLPWHYCKLSLSHLRKLASYLERQGQRSEKLMRAKNEEEEQPEGKYHWKTMLGIRDSRLPLEKGHGYNAVA